ncbi:MAG: HEAT repeat domain-containing protein [Planctomycetota bacterium]|nr:HEAT repeat domain-containing protein [Planctomycetota bacterium]
MDAETSPAESPPSPKPAHPENERLATPAEAILAVEKLGGDVVLDTNAADTRVISVGLFKTKATDNDLRGLKALTTLRALTLVATPVTDAGLEQISGLTNLGLLELDETAISDVGLVHLRGLTRMGELGLSRTKITNRGLAHLKEMKNLVMLLLEGTKISDEGMTHLNEFTRLKTLTLSSTAVTDAGLETLRTLTELHDLRLNYTEVGDAGLAHLAGATELRTLLLHKTKVTDASVQRLSEFKHLRFLDVDKTALTEAGVKQLRTKLPACQIVWNVPKQDLPALLKEFESVEHFWQQEEVGRKLIATGDPRVIPAMKRLLGVPSRRRRCNAGWVLDAMGDAAGLPSVLREFEDTADRAVEPGGRPSKNGVPDVGLQIADDRYYAALVLGRIGKREAVPALIEGLKDETVNLRSAISLAQIGDRQAIPPLRQMAIDSPTKRLWASYGLAASCSKWWRTSRVGPIADMPSKCWERSATAARHRRSSTPFGMNRSTSE